MEKTDNELIAEFMGEATAFQSLPENWKKIIKSQFDFRYDIPQYQTSWEWLHTVIDKIKQLYDREPDYLDVYDDVVELRIATDIKEVHERVVNFIKWYNSQEVR